MMTDAASSYSISEGQEDHSGSSEWYFRLMVVLQKTQTTIRVIKLPVIIPKTPGKVLSIM